MQGPACCWQLARWGPLSLSTPLHACMVQVQRPLLTATAPAATAITATAATTASTKHAEVC